MTGNSENEASLRHMLELVEHVRCEFEKNNALALGEVLHECWMIKRRLAKGITSEEIDNWYNRARTAGAIGGKILGAGGGGFLLIFAPPDRHEAVIRALPELRRVKLGFDRIGTAIIFSEPNQYELDQDEVQRLTLTEDSEEYRRGVSERPLKYQSLGRSVARWLTPFRAFALWAATQT